MISATWLGFAAVLFVGVWGLGAMLFRPRQEVVQKRD